jgi:hypothetical protein
MGSLYTNTDNAIRLSANIIGLPGPTGYLGPVGPRGPGWAWMDRDPTEDFAYRQAVPLSPVVDKFGVPFPTDSTYPVTGNKWVNYVTGDWFEYDSVTETWGTVQGNILGAKGSDNYLKTEVSFNSNVDTKGFKVNKVNKSKLIGHLIYPGSSVSGPINNVQVLVQSSSDSKNFRASIYLVNVGQITGVNDDIVVASSNFTSLSGKGDDTSWKILNLNVSQNAVPQQPSVFALFVRLRLNRPAEINHISNIKSKYNDEIAGLYASKLSKLEDTSADSFYTTLEDDYNIITSGETNLKRQNRKAKTSSDKSKSDKEAISAADSFKIEEKKKWNDGIGSVKVTDEEIATDWGDPKTNDKPSIKIAHLIVT